MKFKSNVDIEAALAVSGDVGVGTTAPLRKLHVVGGSGFAVNASASQYYGVYIPALGEGADPRIDIGDWHNAGSTIKWDSSARSLNLDTQYSTGAGTFNITGNDGASTFLTVLPSGNVGIGTTSPSEALEVNGNLAFSGGSDKGIIGPDFRSLNIFANPNSTSEGIKFSTDGGATTEVFIQDGGKVGIGSTNPQDLLHINSDTTDARILLDGHTNFDAELKFAENGSIKYTVGHDAATDSFRIGTTNVDTNPRLVIDSSGNVGIGTTSPDFSLSVGNDSDSFNYVSIRASNTGSAGYLFSDAQDSDVGYVNYNHATNHMGFGTNGSEAARIDSSGNLLVGKTSSSFSIAGHSILSSGYVGHTRDGGNPVTINRLTSDGSLVNFEKDGTTVGSIGSTFGTDIHLGTGNTRLRFVDGSNYIRPAISDGGSSDGLIDLATSNHRFKDLYLSGGVYLGGTGAANKLDDYEEGTWTPAYTPTTGTFTTITTVATGRYTKIGRLVTVFGTVRTSGTLDVTGASGNLAITGLPFACNATLAGGGADISHQLWNLGTDILSTRMSVAAGASQIVMYKNTMNTTSFPSANITVADMSTSGGSFNNLIFFTLSYEV